MRKNVFLCNYFHEESIIENIACVFYQYDNKFR
jgi:hypothetical protein